MKFLLRCVRTIAFSKGKFPALTLALILALVFSPALLAQHVTFQPSQALWALFQNVESTMLPAGKTFVDFQNEVPPVNVALALGFAMQAQFRAHVSPSRELLPQYGAMERDVIQYLEFLAGHSRHRERDGSRVSSQDLIKVFRDAQRGDVNQLASMMFNYDPGRAPSSVLHLKTLHEPEIALKELADQRYAQIPDRSVGGADVGTPSGSAESSTLQELQADTGAVDLLGVFVREDDTSDEGQEGPLVTRIGFGVLGISEDPEHFYSPDQIIGTWRNWKGANLVVGQTGHGRYEGRVTFRGEHRWPPGGMTDAWVSGDFLPEGQFSYKQLNWNQLRKVGPNPAYYFQFVEISEHPDFGKAAIFNVTVRWQVVASVWVWDSEDKMNVPGTRITTVESKDENYTLRYHLKNHEYRLGPSGMMAGLGQNIPLSWVRKAE